MSLSKRGGWRPGAGRKPNPAKPKKADHSPSSWGGARPGSGRKFKPRRDISRAELLGYVHREISPPDLDRLFDQARAGDLSAMRQIFEGFTRSERAAQADLAAPVSADLFAAGGDQNDSEADR